MLRAHEGLLKQTHLHNLLAANLLSKVVQLLSFCYPTIPVYRNSFISIENKHNDKNFCRPVISCRADVPLRPFCIIFGKSVKLTLGRNAIFRDELPICTTVLGRTTVSRDKRRFWASASNDTQPAEKAPQITGKLAQLVGKWVRPAFDKRRDAANAMPNSVNGGRNAGKLWRNAKKFRRDAIAQWRDATNAMPKAVNRGRNAGTEGQNAIWRGQNASLCFSLSTTLFCAFQYLLGRTAIFRDEQPICSTVLGRTTVSRDKRRGLAGASNDRQPASFMARNAAKATRKVGKLARTAFIEKCSVTTYIPIAVNVGRTAEIRDQRPVCSAVLGRTTINRDEFSFCTFFPQKGTQKLLAANLLSKVVQLLSFYYPKFWRPVIRCRAHVPSRSCCGWFGKSRWYAEGGRRDATNAMPKAVNRGRNAFNGERNAKKIWRNAKKFGRNASALTQGAIPSRDRFFGLLCKRASHTLKPYSLYLITLKILFCVCLAHARQSSSPEAAHGVALSTDSIKPLKIGDSIPEALWNLPFQMVKAGQEGSTTVKLSDYKGKLIILDFWATWCGGCIKEMPKVGGLIKKYQKDLTLLSVTAQDEVTVKAFFARRQELIDLNLQLITDASALTSYFPYRLVPHIVWIGADGTFLAATSSEELNTERLQLLVDGKAPSFTSVKEDILDVDYNKPLLVKKPDDDFSYLYNANLSTYRNGYQSRLGQTTDSSKFRLYAINVPLLSIFKWGLNLPVSWYRNRISFDDGFSDETLWMSGKSEAEIRKNSYCYELIVPIRLKARAKTFLLRDMERYFGFQATVEQREVNCLVLRCKDGRPDRSDVVSGFNNLSDTSTAIKTLSGRVPYFFVDYLNKLLDFKPVLDETGIDYQVDISFDSDEVRDLEKINKSLAKHHLVLEEEQRPIKMLIISKKSTNP
ncbi:TlpA disulfide reductase family protein [Olivibacter sp. CPCC 100613]|uniref:TlpA family protein disulfide reductase n=1 Tax=Olivibacter sp. CPCC 100613 TaxID=3079931 RepID=UPI002FF4C53C